MGAGLLSHIVDDKHPSLSAVRSPSIDGPSVCICSSRLSGFDPHVFGVSGNEQPLRLLVEAARDGGVLEHSFCVFWS